MPTNAKRTKKATRKSRKKQKTRTTLTIDSDVLKLVKVQAARRGLSDGEVIEESLRRDLGLDLLDRIWSRSDLGEQEAMNLALEAQRATRRKAK